MSVPIFDGFEVLSKKAIDNRYVCYNLTDVKRPYDGLVTFQVSDKTFYRRVDGTWKSDKFDLIDSYGTSISNLNVGLYNDRKYNEKNSNNHILGIEYLNYYHDKVRTKSPVKIIWSGDSTTYGTSILDNNFKLNNLAKSFLENNGVQQVTSINSGHESMNALIWLNQYLAQDLTQNPDLYVIRWGFNYDGTLDTRLDNYLYQLRTGLASLRAQRNANNLSVIICSPNSGDDDINHRNAEWFDKIHPHLIQIARDYQCCFADFYHYMYDSHNLKWQDETLYEGVPTHVHPLESANANFISLLSEPLLPTTLRKGNVYNPISTSETKGGLETPSKYPYGVSIYRTGNDFPYNGLVYNILSADGVAFQINSSLMGDINGYAIRRGMRNIGVSGSIGDDTWDEWIMNGVTVPYDLSLQNSWVQYGGTFRNAQYFKDSDGIVHLHGMVKSGVLAGGTIIATLPLGYRLSKDAFFLTLCDTANATIKIDSSGNIKTQNVPTNVWLSLEGITFRAEA